MVFRNLKDVRSKLEKINFFEEGRKLFLDGGNPYSFDNYLYRIKYETDEECKYLEKKSSELVRGWMYQSKINKENAK